MITRRNALMGAAVATLLTAMPALAAELDLPRQKIDLVAPPFVHPHEQATTQKPKIMEFTPRSSRKRRSSSTMQGHQVAAP